MLHPIKLEPTYRDYVWGGNRLRPDAEVTAEAWIVYEKNKIINGPHSNQTLAEAAEEEGEILLGSIPIARTGTRFPLLIKLLDCAKWLSLQVHPNNEQAQKLEGPNHFGKTEAWYVVEADEGAQLLSGFREEVTRDDIQNAVGKKSILDLVNSRDVQKGDTLFISPGTIHALGPGLLIYEIQQTSDLTYRVYDWDRPKTGRRKLHIDQAIEVLDPNAKGDVQPSNPDITKSRQETLVNCEYFTLELLTGQTGSFVLGTQGKSFSSITVLEGKALIQGENWQNELGKLDTYLIPAICSPFSFEINTPARVLHAFVS